MRKPQPLRWIEEAEAKQAVTVALSETPPMTDAPRPAPVAPPWIARLRRWRRASPAVAITVQGTTPNGVMKPQRR